MAENECAKGESTGKGEPTGLCYDEEKDACEYYPPGNWAPFKAHCCPCPDGGATPVLKEDPKKKWTDFYQWCNNFAKTPGYPYDFDVWYFPSVCRRCLKPRGGQDTDPTTWEDRRLLQCKK